MCPRSRSIEFDAFSPPPGEARGFSLWFVDVGLAAAIFVLPFVMGGRQAIGEFTLAVIACWTAFAWLVHAASGRVSGWRFSGLEPLLIAGIVLCLIQTLSLGPEWVEAVSPHLRRLLPLWESASAGDPSMAMVDGPWASISLVPAATRSSLCCVIAVAMLFVVAVQRVDTVADAKLLMRAVAVSAALMAIFGSVQFLSGNGKFFGVYDHPFTHTRDYAKGAFTNPNHFANFLAMSVPILLAWHAVHAANRNRIPRTPYPSFSERLTRWSGAIALVCLAAVGLGILLSQSRGGLITTCVGSIVTLVILYRQRLLSLGTTGTIGGIAIAALLSLTLFGNHIQSLVEHNFHELVSGDIQQLDRGDARRKIWAAAVKGISDYPLLGTGLSTHREVYWTYFDHPEVDGEYSHAENGYLQLVLETGLVGGGIAAATVLVIAFWCGRGLWRHPSQEAGALLAAVTGALAVNLVHSITDFVWYVPACMTVVALLAACACRLDRLSVSRRERPVNVPSCAVPSYAFRGAMLAGAAGVLAISMWMVQVKRPAIAAESLWFDYIRIVRNRHQSDDEFEREEHERHKLATILAAAKADPSNCRIQMRAASAALTKFHEDRAAQPGSMSLANIRDAARASQWESPQQLQDWLNNPGVLGDRAQLDEVWNRTRHALSLCPLLAEGYIRLAEIAWIYGATSRDEDALLVQSLLVRPYDPLVHFAAGREAWLRGKETAALDHWKRAFDDDAKYQQLIINLLAPVVPAQFLLDNFDPDTDALVRLRDAYRNSHDPSGLQSICQILVQRLSHEAAAASHQQAVSLWQKIHETYIELGDAEGARRSAEAAVAVDPNSYTANLLLGRWCYMTQDYATASKHLHFCHLLRPQDAALNQMLRVAKQNAHQSVSRVAAETLPGFSTQRR